MNLLKGMNTVPIKEMENFEGKLIQTPNGETIIDFGQNLAGYVEFTVFGKDGETIVLTHGESLDENGNFTTENFQDRKRHKEGGTYQMISYIWQGGMRITTSRDLPSWDSATQKWRQYLICQMQHLSRMQCIPRWKRQQTSLVEMRM